MTDRLTEIKARLALAETYKWTKTENNWSTTTIYAGDSTICTLQIDEDLDEDDEAIEEFTQQQADNAEFLVNAPSDIGWLIAELEKERAEKDKLVAWMDENDYLREFEEAQSL